MVRKVNGGSSARPRERPHERQTGRYRDHGRRPRPGRRGSGAAGAQPQRGGLKKLSELGIKTVINLRGASDDTRKEQAEAEASGMRYFNIPMSGLGRPSDEQMERALAVIDAKENWPVFVHCQRGADRTGVVIAVYRILRNQWTAEQAIYEAKRFGLAGLQFRKKDYISDYYKRRRDARQ